MIVIYGADGCVDTVKAKELLIKHNVPCKYVNLNRDKESLKMLVRKGYKTTPQCFDDWKHIGGYCELEKYIKKIRRV